MLSCGCSQSQLTINRKRFALAASPEFQLSSNQPTFVPFPKNLRRLRFESCPDFLAVTHKKLVGCSSLLGFKAEILVFFPGRPVLPAPRPRPSSGDVSGSSASSAPCPPKEGVLLCVMLNRKHSYVRRHASPELYVGTSVLMGTQTPAFLEYACVNNEITEQITCLGEGYG